MMETDAVEHDPYFKKTLTLRHSGRRLALAASQELFSSHDVDKGSRLLLRTLTDAKLAPARVLDLGGGYGPIGLGVKAGAPEASVDLLDRDALAVRFAAANAAANGFEGVRAYGSLGYDDVAGAPFDLIVSNIPGKGTQPLYEHVLLDARGHLSDDGVVAVVVVAPLADVVSGILERGDVEILRHAPTADYEVFHYRFTSPAVDAAPGGAFDRGVYDRTTMEVAGSTLHYRLSTVHGLPEFDALGFHTELVLDELARLGETAVGRAVVFNPGQGHAAVALADVARIGHLELVDRDLLALRITRANLHAGPHPPAVELVHCVTWPSGPEADVVIDLLRAKEPVAAAQARLASIAAALAPGGRLIVSGTSTAVTRYVTGPGARQLRVRHRGRRRGHGVAVLTSTGAGGEQRREPVQ